jgi:hypothetical protein
VFEAPARYVIGTASAIAATTGLLALIGRGLWRSPDWAHKWLAVARDLRKYRNGN